MSENKTPFYCLKYFKGLRARGEPARLMFQLAGVEYEREDYSKDKWMGTQKALMPLNQVPVLDTQDGTLVQTTAITNYIAKKLGFQPESDWDQAVSDSILVSLNDVISLIGLQIKCVRHGFIEHPGEDKFQANIKDAKAKTEKTLEYVQKQAKDGAKFMFCDRILVADLMLYSTLEFCCTEFPELKERSDWMKIWLSNMENDEKFAEYLKNRDDTNFF